MSRSLKIQVIPVSDLPMETKPVKKTKPVVLVVDDEKVIADTLSVILSRSGFDSLTAYDGESALLLAKSVPVDLLLSDVMMGPGMDGTQLAIEVIQAHPACKVLLFSGHAATRSLLHTARQAGHDFTLLNKPLHPADLLARISETLNPARLGIA